MPFSPIKQIASDQKRGRARQSLALGDNDWINNGTLALVRDEADEMANWVSPITKRQHKLSKQERLDSHLAKQAFSNLLKPRRLSQPVPKSSQPATFQKSSSLPQVLKFQNAELQAAYDKLMRENEVLKRQVESGKRKVIQEAKAKGTRVSMLRMELARLRQQKEAEQLEMVERFQDMINTKQRMIVQLQRRNEAAYENNNDMSELLEERDQKIIRITKALSSAKEQHKVDAADLEEMDGLLRASEEDLKQAEEDQLVLVHHLRQLGDELASAEAKLTKSEKMAVSFKNLMKSFNQQVVQLKLMQSRLEEEKAKRQSAEQQLVMKQRIIEALKGKIMSLQAKNNTLQLELSEHQKKEMHSRLRLSQESLHVMAHVDTSVSESDEENVVVDPEELEALRRLSTRYYF